MVAQLYHTNPLRCHFESLAFFVHSSTPHFIQCINENSEKETMLVMDIARLGDAAEDLDSQL